MLRLYLHTTEGMNHRFRLESDEYPNYFSLFWNIVHVMARLNIAYETDSKITDKHLTNFSSVRAASHNFYEILVESEDLKSFIFDIKMMYPEEFI